MTIRHMAIKLEYDKRQRTNICRMTSLLATDSICIESLIDIVTGADLQKLNCEVRIICLS